VHVDTRGVGSYALIPPSVVGEGRYTLEDSRSPVPLDPVVGEYLERLKREHVKAASADLDKPENIARASRLLRDYVARGHVAVEGQMGDQRTFVTACEVMNLGLNSETAADLIADLWNPHCVPPWDDEELRTKVENAARYAQNEAGAWAVETSQDVFGSALDKLAPDDPEASAAPLIQRRPFRFYTPAELDDLPPPSFLIPELIPDKGISMLYGPPGSFKTYAAIHWAHQLASVGVPVAYVAGEGYYGVNQRAKAWRLAHDVPKDVPFYLAKRSPSADDGEESLDFLKELEPLKPALVVIDTLARASGGLNENDARDMNQFVRFLDKVRDVLDCAILVIHHTGKDEGRGARGSNALTGATDAAFEVQADKRTKSVAIWCRRQKDAPEREEPWCFEGRDVAGQMVLQPIKHADYIALTRVNDALAPKEVGALLRGMGAIGEDRGVTTHALAFELVNRSDPDLTDDARDTLIARQTRVLGKLAQKSLEAYCIGSGKTLAWFVP
jgi:hypothetical protein